MNERLNREINIINKLRKAGMLPLEVFGNGITNAARTLYPKSDVDITLPHTIHLLVTKIKEYYKINELTDEHINPIIEEKQEYVGNVIKSIQALTREHFFNKKSFEPEVEYSYRFPFSDLALSIYKYGHGNLQKVCTRFLQTPYYLDLTNPEAVQQKITEVLQIHNQFIQKVHQVHTVYAAIKQSKLININAPTIPSANFLQVEGYKKVIEAYNAVFLRNSQHTTTLSFPRKKIFQKVDRNNAHLSFDEKTHEYKSAEGEDIPYVSAIIAEEFKKAAISTEAMQEGTKIHTIVQYCIQNITTTNGRTFEIDTQEVLLNIKDSTTQKEVSYIAKILKTALENFANEVEPITAIESEVLLSGYLLPMQKKHLYGGTADIIINNKYIVDIKTRNVDANIEHEKVAYQLALYSILLNGNDNTLSFVWNIYRDLQLPIVSMCKSTPVHIETLEQKYKALMGDTGEVLVELTDTEKEEINKLIKINNERLLKHQSVTVLKEAEDNKKIEIPVFKDKVIYETEEGTFKSQKAYKAANITKQLYFAYEEESEKEVFDLFQEKLVTDFKNAVLPMALPRETRNKTSITPSKKVAAARKQAKLDAKKGLEDISN